MPALDAQDRVLIAKIAAAERWGRTPDRTAATAAAREGRRAKLAHEIDPTGSLPPQEVERRVDQLMRAHMLRMSRLAAQARRKARQLIEQADQADADLSALGGEHGDAA